MIRTLIGNNVGSRGGIQSVNNKYTSNFKVPLNGGILSLGKKGEKPVKQGDQDFKYERYLRPTTITFRVVGLKPNTIYYPFYGNVYVGQYCTQANSPSFDADGTVADVSTEIKTNDIGVATGVFFLPAKTFPVGKYNFKLVDNTIMGSTGLALTPNPNFGVAEGEYSGDTDFRSKSNQITDDLYKPTTTSNSITGTDPLLGSDVVYIRDADTCVEKYFEYTVEQTESSNFIVTTTSATPPTSPNPTTGMVGDVVSSGTITVSYVSTLAKDDGTYEHKFLQTTPRVKRKYRQIWKGLSTATPLPEISGFRPTGIDSDAIVTVTTGANWITSKTIPCTESFGVKVQDRADYIAQSFFVDGSQYSEGVFITSLDIYFKKVDQSAPVTLEIRQMNGNVPGDITLPNSKIVLPGYATMSSSDASAPTRFRFRQPIYLKPSKEYCFILSSPAVGYEVWCSVVGDKDTITSNIIDDTSFKGTLFRNVESTFWEPSSSEDIKFNMYTADFDISGTGQPTFYPRKDSNNYIYSTARILPLSFMSTISGSAVVTFRIPNHGLKVGDKFRIANVTQTNNGISASNLNGLRTVVSVVNDNTITFNAAGNADRTGRISSSDTPLRIKPINSIMPDEPIIASAERFVDPSNKSASTVPSTTLSITAPTLSNYNNDNVCTVYTNLVMDEIAIDYIGTELDGASIEETVKLYDIDYTALGEVTLNKADGFVQDASKYILATQDIITDRGLNSQNNGKTVLGLTSTNKNISPVVDLTTTTLVSRTYNINNQNDELDGFTELSQYNDPAQNSEINPRTGVAVAKYKSPIITLDNYYNDLSIFVIGNCPSPAIFDVYARISADDTTHKDQRWNWIPLNGDITTSFTNSPNYTKMNEWYFNYTWPFNAGAAVNFSVYDIKIVMRTTNRAIVPKIYSIRAIANLV